MNVKLIEVEESSWGSVKLADDNDDSGLEVKMIGWTDKDHPNMRFYLEYAVGKDTVYMTLPKVANFE